MCGIVGYIGQRKAYPILIKGLKRLEYRGYDSAGVALISDNRQLNVYKAKGKVSELETFVAQKDISGSIGIAHTRWATHGEPCSVNAHPHYSSSERLALIHNGIIENYAVLKEKLQAKGYVFKSSTDTEVLVQLIEYIQVTNHIDLLTAVQLALQEVIGAYAIAVLDKDNPDGIIAARKSSPLVVGIGEGEFFLASDATPIVEYTDKVVYLEDEEIALIRRGEKLKVVNLKNVECPHEVKTVALNLGQLEKGGYPHFMLKEIFEQPGCIHDCMRGRINVEGTNVVLSAVIDYKERLLAAKRFVIVACGTSWHAALIGKHLIESFCRIPVEVEYASEFRYRDPVIDSNDVVIAISQSGETADTLAAVELAKSCGAFIYGICNAVGSSIPRATHTGSYIHVGPEIGVASTKAFTGQVTVLTMLALTLAKEKAENADLSKSAFLANMSPEIRTPLNAITGFAEVLASANTEEEKAQYQEIIKMNADLLLQLVNDILDMSKIEAGTLEFVYTKVDINLLLSDLRQLFQMKVNDAGGNIQIIAEPSLPSCSIETDRNRVAQVLSNFTTNAIKFTQEGTISIGYEARDTELYFYVTDTGAGIPADKLPEVFGRFVKLNKDKKGTGLGLSISKTIVNKLEGQIGADSVEGKGSTFWFTIPYRTCGRPE